MADRQSLSIDVQFLRFFENPIGSPDQSYRKRLAQSAQPEVFKSIPDAMWWGVVTLTTVGYGDIYPKTVVGKFIGAFIALLGIGLFALPAGIIASGFASEIHKEEEPKVCPHCGKVIDV